MTEFTQFTLLPRMPFGSVQHGVASVISGLRYFLCKRAERENRYLGSGCEMLILCDGFTQPLDYVLIWVNKCVLVCVSVCSCVLYSMSSAGITCTLVNPQQSIYSKTKTGISSRNELATIFQKAQFSRPLARPSAYEGLMIGLTWTYWSFIYPVNANQSHVFFCSNARLHSSHIYKLLESMRVGFLLK